MECQYTWRNNMNHPERDFWQAIRPAIPGFVQRIESSTGNGIPDVFVYRQGIVYWLELKVWQEGIGILLRKEQYAWAKSYVAMGGTSFVLTYIPDQNIPMNMLLMNMRDVKVESYGTQMKYVKVINPELGMRLSKKSDLNGLPQKFLFT